ncbi:MAG: hypothetical protein Q7K48_04440 [Fusobacterium sp. JB021]|nr:hypothetical protein [Fusobacterium sp. JB021]MDP0505848.1 hypothetical protein [Fusobacterium sp. JB019]
MEKTMNEIKVFILCGITAFIAQFVGSKGNMDLGKGFVGILLIILVSFLAIKIREKLPLKIPAFAWASLLAFVITTPISPVQGFFLDMTKGFGFSAVSTVILGAAGISVGNKLNDIKKLSWKIVLTALVVFTGTFFGSALIAQAVLKAQGII